MAKGKFRFYFLWLSIICIFAFILQILIPGFTELFVLNNKAIILNEYWRFLTAIFLHGDTLHILYNLFALILFGIILEKKIGSNKFLIVFLTSGIIANIIAVNFYESSLGASGAIYGIIGCLAILSPLMVVWAFGLPMPMFIASVLWIMGDIFGIFFPSNVGNIAHLSGIAVGIIFGILFRSMRKQRFNNTNEQKQKFLFSEDYARKWEDAYIR